MTLTTFLQIFLFINVFFMGVLASVAIRHANAHYRPAEPKNQQPPPATPVITLPANLKEHLLQNSQIEFENALKQAAGRLQQDLGATSEQMNNLIRRLATEIVNNELQRFRIELTQIHKQVEADVGGVKQELVGHQAELKAQLAQDMAVEKQKLLKQIDTKLGDAVGSFLLETLGHNVDLGSQSAYLTALLEEHKAEFMKEVGDETPAA